MNLKQLLFLKAAAGSSGKYVEFTATGNPATFSTNVIKALNEFTIPLSCSQGGSGDPSPSNVRPITGISGFTIWQKGKNLIDDSIKYQYSDYTVAVGNEFDFTIPLSEGSYTLSVDFLNGANYGAYIREKNDNANTELWYSGSGISGKTFTIPKDGLYRLWFYSGAGADADNIGHCQLEVGSVATDYEAYNEGTTYQIAFPALGKNLFDANDDKKLAFSSSYNNYSVVNGNIVLTGNSTGGYIMPCLPNTKYTYSVTSTYTGTNLAYRVYASDEYPTSISSMEQIMNVLSSGSANTFTTGATTKWLVIGFYYSYTASIGTITLSNVQVEQGNTSTSYEPYTNTAYGGTLDVTTGVLTLTHAYRKYVGASGEQWHDNSSHPGCFVTQWAEVKNKGVTMCNMSPANNNTGDFPAYGYVYNQNSSYNVRTHIVDEALTVSQFKSWLAEHPLELVCPLINSVTVQLDPITIQTLIGTNTIWTNTNGSNTIKYLKKEG